MKIRTYLKTFQLFALMAAVGLLLATCTLTEVPETPKQPNVILLITDDQGYGDFSFNGNPILKTPNMDRVLENGTIFQDFHVDPTCAPSRAALLTGRYSARTGVWMTYMGRHHLSREEVTMADIFSTNGYRTGMFTAAESSAKHLIIGVMIIMMILTSATESLKLQKAIVRTFGFRKQ